MQFVRRVGPQRSAGWLGLLLGTAAVAPIACGAARADTASSTPAVAPLVVDAKAPPSVPLLTQPVAATPQSITVIPAEVIQFEGLTDLRDVLRLDPSVSAHADEDSAQGTNVQIRGFSARFDIYHDGHLDPGGYYRDPFDLAAVEVLTGPSSVLFGRGSTGGVIDDIGKTPTLDGVQAATLSFGTDDLARFTGDLDAPLGPAAAFRLNAVAHNEGIAGRDEVYTRRLGISPIVAFGLGERTQLTLSLMHQTQWDRPDYGVPWIDIGAPGDVSLPAAVPWNNYYGFRDDYSHVSVDIATARLATELGDGWSLHDALRYAVYGQSFRIAEPGIPAIVAPGTPLSSLSVVRTERGGRSTQSLLEDDADVTKAFETFGVAHTLVIGGSVGRQTSDPTVLSFSGVPGTNLIDPDEDQAFSGVAKAKTIAHFTAETAAAYVGDTITEGPWQLDLDGRVDRFEAHYRNAVPTLTTFDHTDVAPTWRAALVYAFTPAAHAYVMAGTSFDPSAEGLSLSASTADLAPETTRTVEAGIKWSATPTLLVTGALFDTTMFNAREPSPTDPSLDILAGAERSRGLEIEAQGRITPRWLVQGGVTFLDARIIASPNADVGQPLQNAPKNAVRLFSVYDLSDRLTIGGGFDYQSSRVPASVLDANGFTQRVPGYWTAAALVRYRVSPHVALQLNADNLFNARYYDGLDDNHVNVGDGRSVQITVLVQR